MVRAIYLNGTSSAGKTTIASLLQEHFSEPFLLTGIDLLIRHILPKKFFISKQERVCSGFYWERKWDHKGQPMMQLHMDSLARTTWEGMVQATVGFMEAGNSVIIDDVAFSGRWQVDYWKEALHRFEPLFVGVQCPLELIEQREIERGDRMKYSARAQYYTVHDGVEYDVIVDTGKLSPAEAVQKIISAFS